MSATDELRRLLDERGVEWRGGLPTETMVEADGLDLLYVTLPDGRVRAFIRNYLTPEQAVDATLGRGTCEVVSSIRHDYEGGYGGTEYEHELSCGHKTWWADDDPPEWCPYCGRKVVDA